jgi:2-polyprenyl-3-methyl-5-hydroxy-6-metoxy-1,4-benzoquinol methylase
MPPLPESGAPVVWEETACPLCGATRDEPLIKVLSHADQAVYRVVRCRACGMAYLNPRPNEATIGHFYADEYECYQPPARTHEGPWARLRRALERLALARTYGYPPPLTRRHQQLLAALATPLLGRARNSLTALPFVGAGKMLDFGCGSGWYAQRMREQGWDVTGMDFSEHAAREVTRRYGIPVHVGSLPHPAVAPESFDLITMGCVLEHVHRPHDVIAGAAAALRPGGRLVIVVPNLASWGFRYFREGWWPLELPRHLLHFTPPTLRRLVEDHGLEVVEERMLERGSWMRRSFGFARCRRWRSPVRRVLARLSRVRAVPSLLTRWTIWTGQSDAILIHARRPLDDLLWVAPTVPVAPAA